MTVTRCLLCVLFFLCAWATNVSCQSNRTWLTIAGKTTIDLGTKINRIGFEANISYLHPKSYFQINASWSGYLALNSWGPNIARKESQLGMGVVGLFGEKGNSGLDYFSLVHHQSKCNYALAYSLIWYFDDIGTSQTSGQIALHLKEFSIITENDLFGFTATDKYRTGAFMLSCANGDWIYSLNAIFWTADAYSYPSKRIKAKDTNYPSRHGYFNMGKSKYVGAAQSVLSFSATNTNFHNQSITAHLGVDAEQVRHFIQNKLMHDQPFIPIKLSKAHNPHVPMIDAGGNLYLFKPNQKIRPAKFFGLLRLNSGLFY